MALRISPLPLAECDIRHVSHPCSSELVVLTAVVLFILCKTRKAGKSKAVTLPLNTVSTCAQVTVITESAGRKAYA
jgi:hypothetical protein